MIPLRQLFPVRKLEQNDRAGAGGIIQLAQQPFRVWLARLVVLARLVQMPAKPFEQAEFVRNAIGRETHRIMLEIAGLRFKLLLHPVDAEIAAIAKAFLHKEQRRAAAGIHAPQQRCERFPRLRVINFMQMLADGINELKICKYMGISKNDLKVLLSK